MWKRKQLEEQDEERQKWDVLTNKPGAYKICSGLVLIRGGLEEEAQKLWVQYAVDVGDDESQGLWSVSGSGEKAPNLGTRGRVYDDIDRYKDVEEVAAVLSSAHFPR
jgi:hypothetical protein